jgi:hypothetical protein
MEKEPVYYGAVPAPVLHCRELGLSAKVFYAELSALANKKGYCFANNEYFARLYRTNSSTITRWIKSLSEQGFIKVTYWRDRRTKKIMRRHIFVLLDANKCYEKSVEMGEENFYGVLPAEVRYCEGLHPGAKLLYGNLKGLSSKNGYCYACNDYLAGLYGVHKGSVSRWVSELQEKGFVRVMLNPNERRIYVPGVEPEDGSGSGNVRNPVADKNAVLVANARNPFTDKSEQPLHKYNLPLSTNAMNPFTESNGINAINANEKNVDIAGHTDTPEGKNPHNTNARENNIYNNIKNNIKREAASPSALPEPQQNHHEEKKRKTPEKHIHGEYRNVLLTDDEYNRFVNEFGAEKTEGIIQNFSTKKEMKGYKYKSDYLAIRNWGIRAYEERFPEGSDSPVMQDFYRLIEAQTRDDFDWDKYREEAS